MMPISKQQLVRFRIIDNLLNRWSHHYVSLEELLDRCEVSERTIKGDMACMREEYGAPIQYSRREKGYYYKEGFQMPSQVGLSMKELMSLRIAASTLAQYSHIQAFQGLEGIFQKLNQAVRFKLKTSLTKPNIHFETVPSYKGTEYLDIFLMAIEAEQWVRFTYHAFKNPEPVVHVVAPYALKEHTHRWYVIGKRKDGTSLSAFAVDRMLADTIEVLTDRFQRPSDFDLTKYYQFTVGMTVHEDHTPLTVKLYFQPLQAKYFLSKPFHAYQILHQDEQGLVVSMQLRPNYELIRKLAGMGKGVKVLSPQTVITSLQEYLQSALDQYLMEN